LGQSLNADAAPAEIAKAEISVRDRQGAGPYGLSDRDAAVRRRPQRGRPRLSWARPAVQRAKAVDEAQVLQTGPDIAPVRLAETVDHKPVAVEQQRHGAVSAAMAGRGHIGATAAMVEIPAEGSDEVVEGQAREHGRLTSGREPESSLCLPGRR